ncbi:hypothetical protein ACFOEN_12140 [Piscinibacterium candidicorallinum]|uniref:Tripartite ATP-independent transporter, DctQ component n=1 Tax=Piscinibacterium candidicorallinum TaxID=1793872 RepID=A0ABV7H6Y5_9BURK
MKRHPATDIPEPIPAFSWRGALNPPFLILLLCATAIPLLAPVDVLERSAVLTTFSEMVREAILKINPSWDIATHANSTRYPQMALLANAFFVIAFYLAVAISCTLELTQNYNIARARRAAMNTHVNGGALFGAVILTIFALISPMILTGMQGDPSWVAGLTTNNRIGYSMVLGPIMFSLAFVVGQAASYMRFFYDTKRGEKNA